MLRPGTAHDQVLHTTRYGHDQVRTRPGTAHDQVRTQRHKSLRPGTAQDRDHLQEAEAAEDGEAEVCMAPASSEAIVLGLVVNGFEDGNM